MRIIVTLILLMLFVPFGTKAETVSQKEASRIAEMYFNEAYGQKMQSPKLVWNGRKLTTNSLFNPFYVYNHPAGGFVIVSAENKAFPILGYSRKSAFNPDKLSDFERRYFRRFAEDIENVRYIGEDSSEAKDAWGNISEYIYGVVHSQSDVTDPSVSIEEADEDVMNVVWSRKDEFFSDIYTPDQWSEIIRNEFEKKRSVALGVIDDRMVTPGIVHGVSGDYFRIDFGKRNDWFLRLCSTDLITPNMVASVVNPPIVPEAEDLETPFRFYEEFVAQSEAEQNAMQASRRIPELEQLPYIQTMGGGHFQIKLPEDVVLARVFTLQGGMTQEKYYKSTDQAYLDLSVEPSGFYIALLVGQSGKPYGFKLYR